MHNDEHVHTTVELKLWQRLVINLSVVAVLFVLVKPFIVVQITNRGDGFLNYRMFKRAAEKYKIALFFNPAASETWNWLGYSYEQLGRKDKAVETYNKAVKIDPNNRIAYFDAGMIYMKNGDYGTAAEYFIKSSNVASKYKISGMEDNFSFHRSALAMLAHCYEKMGLTEKEADVNNEILKYYPEDKGAQKRIKEHMADRQEGL